MYSQSYYTQLTCTYRVMMPAGTSLKEYSSCRDSCPLLATLTSLDTLVSLISIGCLAARTWYDVTPEPRVSGGDQTTLITVKIFLRPVPKLSLGRPTMVLLTRVTLPGDTGPTSGRKHIALIRILVTSRGSPPLWYLRSAYEENNYIFQVH